MHLCPMRQSSNPVSLSLLFYLCPTHSPRPVRFVQENAEEEEEDEDEWDEQGQEDLQEGKHVEGPSDDAKKDEDACEDQVEKDQGKVYNPESCKVEANQNEIDVAGSVGHEVPQSQGHGSDPGFQNKHPVGSEVKMKPDQPPKGKTEEAKEHVHKPEPSSVLVAFHRFCKSHQAHTHYIL